MKRLAILCIIAFSSQLLIAQCSCPEASAPVCAIDEEGQLYVMANACIAACFNLEVVPENSCLNGVDLSNEDCLEQVCVIDVEGYGFVLPLCLANGLGLEIVGDGDCTSFNPDSENGNEDYCDQLVCAVDLNGITYNLPFCEAEELGLLVLADGTCEGVVFENDPNDENTENACDDFVCALDNLGEFQSISICDAEALNYAILSDGICEDLFDALNQGVCDEMVCTLNPDGLIIELSICIAEFLAWPIVGMGNCDDLTIDDIQDEGEEVENNPDCEVMVCIQTPEGEIFQQPLCIAELLGFEILDSLACDLDIEVDPTGGTGAEGLDDDDCETMVCILTPEGEIFEQPYCIAVLNNFEVLSPGNCDLDIIDDEIAGGAELDPNDCETLVCIVSPEGQVFTQPYCLAVLLGFDIVGDGNCTGLNDENNEDGTSEGDETADEEPLSPVELEDLGDWLYETLGVFIDHTDGFEIVEVRASFGAYELDITSPESDEVLQVMVSDFSGRVILDKKVQLHEGKAVSKIDLSEQESGIYLLRVLGSMNSESIKIMHLR